RAAPSRSVSASRLPPVLSRRRAYRCHAPTSLSLAVNGTPDRTSAAPPQRGDTLTGSSDDWNGTDCAAARGLGRIAPRHGVVCAGGRRPSLPAQALEGAGDERHRLAPTGDAAGAVLDLRAGHRQHQAALGAGQLHVVGSRSRSRPGMLLTPPVAA